MLCGPLMVTDLITADDHVTVSVYQMLTDLPCHIYSR